MLTKISNYLFAFALGSSLAACNQQAEEQKAPKQEQHHTGAHEAKPSEGALTIQAQSEPDTLKGSLKAEAHGKVGPAHLTVAYHSPAVRGRMIWGGLVAHDQVWVTGAHSATRLQTDHPIMIGGQEIPAGKYALFTIPGEQEWTVIINKNWNQHLADDYSEAEDVVRLTVKPEANEQHQERLRYEILSQGEGKGAVVMSWDKLKLVLPVGV
ncbi:DUF2911 domain-containing protein [Pontibacter akesuensis]|uniref:DUF2911 domain-containing protein n=1 Tax=Pontibacter akesuensis TaxID=388950 RepID=A0A1I7KFQ5_9BACT|nr:DUF2911 domain-containing protein [Pontibacter akesuensis]GHA79466.1 hypothetical protein GCM10007389_37060 [Pontibacter akesuensis]SFU96311.1 Protein of unknown function [Pontibacter akesuensis]